MGRLALWAIAALMAHMKSGGFTIPAPALDMLQGTFASGRCDEAETS